MANRIEEAQVGLPTLWRVITIIGSLASTIVLVALGIAFDMAKSEWIELRAEVREVKHRLDEMPDGDTLRKLSDDVQDLSRRVDRMEQQLSHWEE